MAADCTDKAGSSTITTRGAASLWHTFLERHGTWSHAILHKVRGGRGQAENVCTGERTLAM
jgi:hypothetical protein